MFDVEDIFRGVVLSWSLLSAAAASLTFIMLRASIRDAENIRTSGRNGELALLSRRVVRGVGSRMVVCATYVVASGTMWTMPEEARQIADISARLAFSVVFAASAGILFVLATRDLMDTLRLIKDKPLSPDTLPTLKDTSHA